MRSRVALALCGFALLGAVEAQASSLAAFEAGDYSAARDAGRGEATAEGLSVACQAGLVLGSYFESGAPQVATLHGAIKDCAEAIQKGGAHVDAYVNYAIGLAFEAKRLHSPRFAGDAKDLLQASIERFPQSGFARGALAGWHANVAEQGVVARTALGASRDTAREGFAAALKLDPKNVALNYEYLRFLAVGGKAERAQGAALAKAIGSMPHKGAFQKLLVERAAIIGAALSKGSAKAAALAVKETEPFAAVAGEAASEKFVPPFSDAFPADPGQKGASQ
jgi:hypothetical protein